MNSGQALTWGGVVVVGLLVLAVALTACGVTRPAALPPPPPDRVDSYGALQVVTHGRHVRGGDASGGGPALAQHWTLRWRDQPLVISTRGGLFGDQPHSAERANAVFVLGDGDAAELIVNVGDPNNTSAFHAVRQTGETPLLCVALGGSNAVGWLDGPQAVHGGRAPLHGPALQRLQGGRLLALGSRCVYDTRQRSVMTLPRPPDELSVIDRLGALSVAPDGQSLVYVGQRRVGNELQLVMAVADLQDQRWTMLPVDRARMRYPTLDGLDAAWLAHHFEWRRRATGRPWLAERANFKPLPRRGRYLSPPAQEYRLEDTVVGARTRLRDFVVQRFGATPLPLQPYEDGSYLSMSMRGERVVVSDTGVHVAPAGSYWPGQPGDPALQQALIREIGAAIDAELAAGRLQQLF